MSARIALSGLVVSTLLLAGYLSPTGTAQVAPPAKEKPHKNATPRPVQKVYQVIDLITPLVANPSPSASPCTGCATCQSKGMPSPVALYLAEMHKECCTACCANAANKTDEDKLLRLIKTTIAPKQWSDVGGTCTAEYWPLTGAMVINAPPDVQEQIMELLAKMRHAYDGQVALEVRFVNVDEAVYERLSAETGMHFSKACDGPLAYLDDEQVRHFMEVLQRHHLTHVMQAPKITMLDGQTASCSVGEEKYFTNEFNVRWDGHNIWWIPVNQRVQLGLQMQLTSAMSADRRYVDVALEVKQTELETSKVPLVPVVAMNKTDKTTGERVCLIQSFPSNRQKDYYADLVKKHDEEDTVVFTQFVQSPKIAQHTLNRKLVLADGKTALLYGWKRKVEHEQAVPILSELPCIGQCFKHDVPGVETVLLMVTPRVIVEQEQEQSAPLKAAPALAASPVKSAPKPYGGSEESEAVPNVDELLAKYHKACAAGKLTAARKLAIKALTMDPTCFDKKR